MCNLYSLTQGAPASRDLFRAKHYRAGNLPLFPSIFPDQIAPIARIGADGERELVMASWGMPGPPQFGGAPITNIRNVKSPRWQAWLRPSSRNLGARPLGIEHHPKPSYLCLKGRRCGREPCPSTLTPGDGQTNRTSSSP